MINATDIINSAKNLIGKVNYVFGANNIEGGEGDCSSFTQYLYQKQGVNIGRVTDVLDYPGNSVYVIGDNKVKDRYMIPAVKEFILSTDLDNNTMQVRLIEGMRTDEN